MTPERYWGLVQIYWKKGYEERKKAGTPEGKNGRWFKNKEMHRENDGAYDVSQRAEKKYAKHLQIWKEHGCWTVHPDDIDIFQREHPGAGPR